MNFSTWWSHVMYRIGSYFLGRKNHDPRDETTDDEIIRWEGEGGSGVQS